MQMDSPGTPTPEHRSAYPDRLWLSDYDEAPPTNTGLYAISNANGTLPAFWFYRELNVTQLPVGSEVISIETKNATDALKIEERLPNYVNVYGSNGCNRFRAQIESPLNGQCYGSFTQYSIISMFVPTYTTGDIFNIYQDDSCQQYLFQLHEFVGCFTSTIYFYSFWPCNVCT
jgi:hypothetical protein